MRTWLSIILLILSIIFGLAIIASFLLIFIYYITIPDFNPSIGLKTTLVLVILYYISHWLGHLLIKKQTNV